MNGDVLEPDAFVLKLAADGGSLVYSTFLGGSGRDEAWSVVLDGADQATVVGTTSSADFSTTPGSFDSTHNGGFDAFALKLSAAGDALLFSTFLGGSGTDWGRSVALDGLGRAVVHRLHRVLHLPHNPRSLRHQLQRKQGRLCPEAHGRRWFASYGTFLGGRGNDYAEFLTLDGTGQAVVTGNTLSSDFPTTLGAYDTSNAGDDVFVLKLAADGSSILCSTFVGGGGMDVGTSVALDPAGRVVVAGLVSSSGFPTTPDAFDTSPNGQYDGFVLQLAPDLGSLLYSTFLGGTSWDVEYAASVALDAAGNVVVAGDTLSGNFPTTPGAYDTSYNGSRDAFIVKLDIGSETDLASRLTAFVGDSRQQLAAISDASADVADVGDYFLDKLDIDAARAVVNVGINTINLTGVDWRLVGRGLEHILTPGYKAALHASWRGWMDVGLEKIWYKRLYDAIHNDRELLFGETTWAGLRYYARRVGITAAQGPIKDWLLADIVPGSDTPVADLYGQGARQLAEAYRSELEREMDKLLAELPSLGLTAEEEQAYILDFQGRQQAHSQIRAQVAAQRSLLWDNYQDALADEANWAKFWNSLLAKWVTTGGATLMWDGPGYYVATATWASYDLIHDALADAQALAQDQKSLDQAMRFEAGRVPSAYEQISMNTVGALNLIRAHDIPQIADGTLGLESQSSFGHYRMFPIPCWVEESSQMELPIANTTAFTVTYLTSVSYIHTADWTGVVGLAADAGSPELTAGSEDMVLIRFKTLDNGVSPDEYSLSIP